MATGGIVLNGSSQYLEMNSKVVSGFPFTLVCWVAQNSNSNAAVIVQQQSTGDRYAMAWLDTNGTSKYANLRNPGNGDSASKLTSPNPSASLQLMVAVFTSTTSRTVYFGDNTGATSTTSMTDDITNHDRITIGAWHYNSGAAGLFLNGVVAEAHIFNTALTSSDVTTLLTTAPENVTGWVDGWKLSNNTDLTSIGGTRTLTAVGSPTTGSLTLPYTRTSGPTTATLTGPTSGTTGAASTNFTVTLDAAATSTVTVTPAGTVGTVTFSPSSLTITAGNTSTTFTATPASDGAHSISITTSPTLTYSGSPITYTTTTSAATAITLTGPSSGTVGSPSTNFTVGANGTITGTIVVTPSDSGQGGTFTPTTVSISSGTPTATFTYTAASAGVKSISVTNNGGLSNPTAISYTASVSSTRTVTLSLTTDGTNPAANLTGLKWAFFDQTNPGSFAAPTAQGTSGSTNSSGVITVTITGTALTAGQTGWLLISDSDGTVSQAPPGKAFSAPVTVS